MVGMASTTKQIPFPDDLWADIRAAADRTDRTIPGVIIRAVRRGLPAYLTDEGIDPQPEAGEG